MGARGGDSASCTGGPTHVHMYIQNIDNLYVQYVAYNDTISRHIEGGLTRATVALLHRRPGQDCSICDTIGSH